jgi:hypothetical protein
MAIGGNGGLGGIGAIGNGIGGLNEVSVGGGVATFGTTCKTADTMIGGNLADFFPNVDGTIGPC